MLTDIGSIITVFSCHCKEEILHGQPDLYNPRETASRHIILLYSRDHKGLGMTLDKYQPNTSLTFLCYIPTVHSRIQ